MALFALFSPYSALMLFFEDRNTEGEKAVLNQV